MASKETERMIKLGEWLESYLNPEIKARGYRELAGKAIRLYNLPKGLDDFCFVITDTLCGLSSTEQNSLINREYFKKLIDVERKEIIYKELDGLPLSQEEEQFIGTEKNIVSALAIIDEYDEYLEWQMEDFNESFEQLTVGEGSEPLPNHPWSGYINYAAEDPSTLYFDPYNAKLDFLIFRKMISELLRKIDTTKSLWDRLMYESLTKAPGDRTWNHTDRIYHASQLIFETISLDSGKAQKTTTFNSDLWVTIGKTKDSLGYLFPWGAMSSKILIEFLLLGGQNHIHFCKQCGRFTVIKRKGRKEYCSSLCRVRASNERIAQAGA